MASRRRAAALLCRLLTASMILSSVAGMFIVERSSIRVLRPEHIKGRYESAIANFGIPNYGGMLKGVVIYPEMGSSGCSPFDGSRFRSRSGRPVILLLDRGDCYFALKAWNGQNSGAAAVLIADNIDEPLITMDTPEESKDNGYVEKIHIPSALINREFGMALKIAVEKGDEEVFVSLDWRESIPNPDERVEYEFWTNSNDVCGARCNEQVNFVQNFKGHAQILERGGYTQFTPHYITWYCPEAFLGSKQCMSQCINHGRYCAPDPEQNFTDGYEGKDVVVENLRQLCVHRVANERNRSWVWWDYVTDFHVRCSMKEKKYSQECADDVIKSLGMPLGKVKECMGDPEADVENPVLMKEQEVQVGRGTRGDVTILPTLVVNNVQYRGVLERTAVLKALCAGFKESNEPSVCLSGDIETNECLERNGGCWQNLSLNVTACKDTFRGRVCECPTVNGIQYQGDGYVSCKAVGPGRCAVDNGGCWSETKGGRTFSACSVLKFLQILSLTCFLFFYIPHIMFFKETELSGCRCPFGFYGNGYKCDDIDECKEKLACQCDGCSCKNTWGGFDCKCKGNLLYIKGEDICIDKNASNFGWWLPLLILSCVVGAGVAGYIFYKYRLRSYMDSEIMAIMSQYMPLDNHHNEAQPLRQDSTI